MVNVKERIIEKVNNIQDPILLEELLQAVGLESEIEHSYELTQEEKTAIDEGIDDAESGKVYSNSEASELVQKWLKK